MAIRVGLISDTHGLLRPAALDTLRGADLIVHAGDVGDAAVLDTLRAMAPVTAVRGNVDQGAWAAALPETATVTVGGIVLYVLHDIAALRLDVRQAQVDVVVFGHSHRSSVERRNEVLFVNPGSAGPRRFTLPTTVAVLMIDGQSIDARIIQLNVPS
jgi:uncharacterized protein